MARAVYPLGEAMLSVLLSSVLTTRLQAVSVTLVRLGHVTLEVPPLFTSGETSSGVALFTPERASIVPDQVLSDDPVQV
jgi:hypothetical protein